MSRDRLAALAGFGLPSQPPLPGGWWDDLLDEAFAQGLVGLLDDAHRAGAVALRDEGIRRLEQRAEAELVHSVRLESELERLRPLLDRCGGVVYKGPALAHGAYADPALRPFTDLDIVVPAVWAPVAAGELAELGYDAAWPEPCPGYVRHVARAVAYEDAAGLLVDVHRDDPATALVGSGATRLLVETGGVAVPAPGWAEHLVAVCVDAVEGDGLRRLRPLRDIAQILVAHGDAATVVDRAAQGGVTSAVGRAVGATAQVLGVEIPGPLGRLASRWASDSPIPDRPARSARARIRALAHEDLVARAVLLRALVIPNAEFLEWKYGPGSRVRLTVRRWRELVQRTTEAWPG